MNVSTVEEHFLKKSNRKISYPGEHIPLIEVENARELGKLTALRFLEWIIENPTGVIALPTGSTPKPFINHLGYVKENLSDKSVRKELQQYGIHSSTFPDTSQLKFVQLDEFFPIDPTHHSSLTYYIKTQYLPLLNLRPENVLLLEQYTHYEVEELCDRYEEQISAWGGIDFFLGGIGPDGHVAFNMRGASFESTTRLVVFNYETAAAASWSLGGIEFSRNKTAVTIGLKTITLNPDATIIIIAAGQGKARMVANTIEKEASRTYPLTVLHTHNGACFYVTHSAAAYLKARYVKEDIKPPQLIKKIKAGLEPITGKRIMHTEPHHDDIMLAYHPLAINLLSNNENHFVSITSSFKAVTSSFMLDMLKKLPYGQLQYFKKDIFEKPYAAVLQEFAAAYKNNDQDQLEVINSLIFARKCAECFAIQTIEQLDTQMRNAEKIYKEIFQDPSAQPTELKQLKGMMREAEVECLWALHNIPLERITHMRAQFYQQKNKTYTTDAQALLQLINTIDPDIITVAFDPPATGPDTHYKVLQMIAETLRMKKDLNPELRIWGYRNVWYRFPPEHATHAIPVSQQKQASFPTHEFDGPFSQLACKIQKEQLQKLKTILGDEYFDNHTDEKIRNAAGMIFLKVMSVDEFLQEAEQLHIITEG